jgi:primosomal protein N''
MADDLLVRVGITEKQYLAAITRMEKQSVRAAKQAEAAFAKSNTRLVRGAQSANKATSALGGQGLRMVSMQLSQVASQGAATGNYLQALAIQAPDLALGFGAVGIAAGALVPILYSLAQGSALFSSEAVDLEDTLEELSQTMTRLGQAQARAGQSRGDLRAEYGDLADEAARLFAIEKQIAAARAAQAIQGAAAGVAGGLGVRGALGLDPNDIRQTELAVSALTDEVIRLRERAAAATDTALAIGFEVMAEEAADMAVQLRAVDGAMGELATSLGVTEEAAREIAAQFAEIAALDAGREQAEAFEALASYIFEASDGLVEATEEGDALYNALWQAVQASLDLAAVDMAGGIGAAASEAERLAAALSRAIAMNPITPDMRDEDAVMSQSVLPDASTRETQRRALENFRRLTAPPKRSGGGGGGGVSKEAAEAKAMAQAAQRYVEETRTGVEQLVAELAELEELNRRGFFAEHPEAYARAVAAVHDELTAIEFEAVLEGIDSVADAMAAAIVQGEDMGEALRDVFRQIAQDLISSGIRQGLMSLIPSSGGTSRGGLLGGLLGGIFGGFRAAGGPVSPGQSYVVGERGPELFTPRSVGSILPNGGGSGGQVEVLVGIDQATGSLVPVIERVSGAVSAQVVSAYGRETRRAQPGQMRQSQARGAPA